jgi:nucleoside phosphorylase
VIYNVATQDQGETDCRVLVRLLGNSTDEHEKILLLEDLLYKLDSIPRDRRLAILANGLQVFLPNEVKNRLAMAEFKSPTNESDNRRHYDVAIITIKPPELLAAKLALGIDLGRRETTIVEGLRIWECEGKDANGDRLSMMVTMIGEAGNYLCSAACGRLFREFRINFSILVGIGAGLKSRCALGDVIAGEVVFDYESGRMEPGGFKKRPRTFSLNKLISRDLQYFQPERVGWKSSYQAAFAKLKQDPHEVVPREAEVRMPSYKTGAIITGEKLLANDSLEDLREEYSERVCCAEMEGAGFARACQENDVSWLIIRGISDFGDSEKADNWQTVSALGASTVALEFIAHMYHKPDKAF